MDLDKLCEKSKPYVSRISAQIDAVKDTCDMLREAVPNMDWNISFRATICLTLITELLGVECSCEEFLMALDNFAKKQLGEETDD